MGGLAPWFEGDFHIEFSNCNLFLEEGFGGWHIFIATPLGIGTRSLPLRLGAGVVLLLLLIQVL